MQHLALTCEQPFGRMSPLLCHAGEVGPGCSGRARCKQGGPAQSLQKVRLALEEIFAYHSSRISCLHTSRKPRLHTSCISCLDNSVSLQAEAQGRMEAGGNFPYMCRENTRKLKASGNVLTGLKGSLDGRLFSNIIWQFSLEPLPEGKRSEPHNKVNVCQHKSGCAVHRPCMAA